MSKDTTMPPLAFGFATPGAQTHQGLSALLDDTGRRVGLGYLEMTGYAGRLVL